jgi:hypothetical protein
MGRTLKDFPLIPNRTPPYLLPVLILLLSLPAATLGVLQLIALSIPGPANESHPLQIALVALEIVDSVFAGALGFGGVALAYALWTWLLARGERTSTKIRTLACLLFASYGLYVLRSSFQMH